MTMCVLDIMKSCDALGKAAMLLDGPAASITFPQDSHRWRATSSTQAKAGFCFRRIGQNRWTSHFSSNDRMSVCMQSQPLMYSREPHLAPVCD